jgi:hypothetical protein
MPVTKVRATLAIAILILPVALLAAACSAPPEQQTLNQFFRAARNRDNETIARMSAVDFDPRRQGEVVDFEITNVSQETRTPLAFRELIDAANKASAAETEFRKKRLEWESKNRPALEAIAKMEREPQPKFTSAQATMKAEWEKWRAEASAMQKATAAAKAAVASATGPAEASLSQPGQPALVPEKFEGELISKDVTINADVRAPGGETSQKTLTVTIQRVVGKMDGTDRSGRSIITRIQGI